MTELQVRRQALLVESDLNRLAIQADCERLTGVRSAIKPWAFWLAGVAVAVSLRRRSGWLGFLAKAAALAGPIVQLWRTHATTPHEQQK